MGTMTAGMTVLRLDDGELLLVDVIGPGIELLEDEECGFEEAERDRHSPAGCSAFRHGWQR